MKKSNLNALSKNLLVILTMTLASCVAAAAVITADSTAVTGRGVSCKILDNEDGPDQAYDAVARLGNSAKKFAYERAIRKCAEIMPVKTCYSFEYKTRGTGSAYDNDDGYCAKGASATIFTN